MQHPHKKPWIEKIQVDNSTLLGSEKCVMETMEEERGERCQLAGAIKCQLSLTVATQTGGVWSKFKEAAAATAVQPDKLVDFLIRMKRLVWG